MSKFRLDEVDHQILDMLIDNTRVPFTDIAKKLLISAGTVHVRVKKMEEAGIIQGSSLTLDYEKLVNFAAQFKEVLIDDEINFIAEIVQIDDLEHSFGHVEYDCEEMIFSSSYGNLPKLQEKADFYLNNLLKYSNGLLIL